MMRNAQKESIELSQNEPSCWILKHFKSELLSPFRSKAAMVYSNYYQLHFPNYPVVASPCYLTIHLVDVASLKRHKGFLLPTEPDTAVL